MPVKSLLLVIAALFAACIAAGEAVAQSDPRVIRGGNGESEVVFRNDCVVYYDFRGRRVDHSDNCRNRQLRRADDAISAGGRRPPREERRRSQSSSFFDKNAPAVMVGGDGSGQVDFGDGCTIYYDRYGDRKIAQACGQGQVRRADHEMESRR